jgi:outer membrane protein OmpA-like peptidoglycan-associated protein
MARQGGKKGGKAGILASGFDWAKVTAIAFALTAGSGAAAAGTGMQPPLPDETRQCPDGSVIPAGQQCPLIVEPATGPFIVFFDWDKDKIIPAAAAILDIVALVYQQYDSLSVALAGHADRSGSDDYNIGLSRRRANAVRAYLAARGVPDAAITSEALGESRPLADTADGVREPQNRRVEITFGPGSDR